MRPLVYWSALLSGVVLLGSGSALAQRDASGIWLQMFNVPLNPDTMLVLTDGTIAVDDYGTGNWWRLVPDKHGNYLDGTWVSMGTMPVETTGTCPTAAGGTNANGCPYAPYDYASVVLPDGRLVVTGGEYTYDDAGTAYGTETTQGAVWDWHTNAWTVLTPPSGWNSIGDADSLVLANGQYLLARNRVSRGTTPGQLAIMTPTSSLTWTNLNPPGKADSNSEENWVLLPDGTIWTVDIASEPGSERYIPPYLDNSTNGEWISAGAEPASIGVTAYKGGSEDGANVLLTNGNVFAISGNPDTGINAIYTPPTTLMGEGTWTAAPNYPNIGGILNDCDGPASLLPNGNVFFTGSAGCYDIPSYYFEYQPQPGLFGWDPSGSDTDQSTSLSQVVSPYDPVAGETVGSQISSFYSRFVVLPDGSMLYSWDDGLETYIFKPTGHPDPKWAPKVTSFPRQVSPGKTYEVSGTQFNGLSGSGYYGDDEANASNYPLVRFTNFFTGDVQYGRTHDHSTMAVATGRQVVSTDVDVPTNLEPGPSLMQVVANGIASDPVIVSNDSCQGDPQFCGRGGPGSQSGRGGQGGLGQSNNHR